MSKIKAVVFDVDGTLLNTFEHIVQAFEVVLPEHGVAPDREAIRLVIGKTLVDCYKALVPEGDHDAMAKLHHETQQTPEMYGLIVAYAGLRETLQELKGSGIKNAVQTNRSKHSINLIFDHVGIHDLFDIIVTPQDVTHPKPDTEGISLIAKQLGVAPGNMVMVGDTPIDVITGKNAGVAKTIGLTHGFGSKEELQKSGADHIVDNLSAIRPIIDKLGNDGS